MIGLPCQIKQTVARSNKPIPVCMNSATEDSSISWDIIVQLQHMQHLSYISDPASAELATTSADPNDLHAWGLG